MQSLPSSSPVSSAARACLKRYGTRFAAVFSPERQAEYAATSKDRMFAGTAPTLTIVAAAYGQNVLETWLCLQLRDLSEFSGCRDKFNADQMNETAHIIMALYPWLKVTELMYFFLLVKGGMFGGFYGVVDGMKVTEALRAFIGVRALELSRIERERLSQATQTREKGISRQQWEAMKRERSKQYDRTAI